jgi:hypothetical protein
VPVRVVDQCYYLSVFRRVELVELRTHPPVHGWTRVQLRWLPRLVQSWRDSRIWFGANIDCKFE